MRARSLVLVFVLAAAAAARADYPVSAPRIGPATGAQLAPALATNGTDALAAWQDQRAVYQYPGVPSNDYPQSDVYAARIAADGTASADVPIAPSPAFDYAPAIAWNGEEYVVAQVTYPNPGDTGPTGVRFTRMSSGETTFLPLDVWGRSALLWNGSEYLFVTHDRQAVPLAILLDWSLHLIGVPMPLGPGPRPGFATAYSSIPAATDGHNFFVVWSDGSAVRLAIVSPSGGAAYAQPPLVTSRPVSAPSVAWDGEQYLVTWTDPVVRAQFVGRDGLAASPVIDLFPSGRETAVAWNGSRLVLLFVSNGNLYGRQLDAAGTPIDAQPFFVASPNLDPDSLDVREVSPVAVAIGSRFLVAWNGADSVHMMLLGGEPQLLAHSLGTQRGPRGVFDGGRFAFVWGEEGQIRFGRALMDGTLLDGPGVVVGDGTAPRISAGIDDYLVVWSDAKTGSGRAARVSRDGKPLDAPIAVPAGNPATDGRDFLLLGAVQSGPMMERWDLQPTVITSGGDVLRRPVVGIDTSYVPGDARVAWDGTHYVVAYVEWLDPDCYKCSRRFAIRDVLLDRSGAPVSPIRTVVAGQEGFYHLVNLTLASAPGRSLLLWTLGVEHETRGAVIDASGIPAVAGALHLTPAIAPLNAVWTGSEFVIASFGEAQRIAAGGTPIGSRFPLEDDPNSIDAALVDGAPRLTAVYERPVRVLPDVPNGAIRRVFFQFVDGHRRRAR